VHENQSVLSGLWTRGYAHNWQQSRTESWRRQVSSNRHQTYRVSKGITVMRVPVAWFWIIGSVAGWGIIILVFSAVYWLLSLITLP
jgi:hypothetical protein